ncbi:NAD-dependent epimerase/dehydratase family protein [Puniceibacterium sediminis]|uniref:Nucleoside-diphosphate-sugar epimerase n=1 Tax=Puniceibacterium sediminis TaxID=1608407 RepID=A0A238YNF0_9RHOB|nr:NAD(P)-dependent oxidoreductase [Puniceibacterium sediminis]SNR72796.1 Nucleoside-diphosphate-sugar epimerase [Puniceibacterium sediminis]
MRIAVTGATGRVGYWIAQGLLENGHDVVAVGRQPAAIAGVGHLAQDLDGPPPDLSGFDALVHAAFSHVPGKYRGGEGDDPDGFRHRNLDGTLRLFDAAQNLDRIVFLSSRAVYGAYPAGTELGEDLPPLPDTLYGMVKHEAEIALSQMSGPATISLRATGVYGAAPPGQQHKWQGLFNEFSSGQTIAPHIATEVHATDLANAVQLVLTASREKCGAGVFNVSDFALDRRDLLQTYAAVTGASGELPPCGDASLVSGMTTERLRTLGWCPGGQGTFPARLSKMISAQHQLGQNSPR